MAERPRIRAKAYDRLSQSLGLEEEANQTDEPEAESARLVRGYARTLRDEWVNSRTGDTRVVSLLVPMTEQEVIGLLKSPEKFDWVFIPTSPGDVRVPCYSIGVPETDPFALASVFERPKWERSNWRELFSQEGREFIDYCDIDWD